MGEGGQCLSAQTGTTLPVWLRMYSAVNAASMSRLKGRILNPEESAGGALKMIGDIELAGMSAVSIAHPSGHYVLIPELEKIAGAEGST